MIAKLCDYSMSGIPIAFPLPFLHSIPQLNPDVTTVLNYINANQQLCCFQICRSEAKAHLVRIGKIPQFLIKKQTRLGLYNRFVR
jgi:hypothetical protein